MTPPADPYAAAVRRLEAEGIQFRPPPVPVYKPVTDEQAARNAAALIAALDSVAADQRDARRRAARAEVPAQPPASVLMEALGE